MIVLLSCYVLAAALLLEEAHSFGVPGQHQTANGYDTEGGKDPICWVGRGNENAPDSVKATPWDNKLYKHFILNGEVELLMKCPDGIMVEGISPQELRDINGAKILTTGQSHDYLVRGSINLGTIEGDTIFSDNGPQLAIQIVLCQLGKVGLCTPFVHEHANDRLIAMNFTEKLEVGDRHGDTHVHSPTVFYEVDGGSRSRTQSKASAKPDITPTFPSREGIQTFEVKVPTRVNLPGDFFAIAAFQLFTSDTNTGVQHKYDVAGALDTRLITYRDPPQVLSVTKSMEIAVAVIIAISAMILLYILVETIRWRKSRVMQLSQVKFLIILIISAIIASGASVLFNPRSDLSCRIRTPCILLPLQVLYAITIGRLWRINVVISPILSYVDDKKKQKSYSDVLAQKFFDLLTDISQCNCTMGRKIHALTTKGRAKAKRGSNLQRLPSAVRARVTDTQLALIIVLLSIPMIILQIFLLTLQPGQLDVHWNYDESVGRQTCSQYGRPGASLERWSWYLLLISIVLMLFLANHSKNLPSLFSETESIYASSIICILVMAIGLATIRLTNGPTTSPDVEYLLRVLIVLTLTLNTVLRTLLPKLKLAWSGQAIVISKLVTDHRIATLSKTGSHNGSSVNASLDGFVSSSVVPSSRPTDSGLNPTFNLQSSSQKEEDADADADADAVPSPPLDVESGPDLTQASSRVTFSISNGNHEDTNQKGPHHTHIHISDKRPPARNLLLRMIDAQKVLENLNRDAMSGYAIGHEEWDEVRDACMSLGNMFRHEVTFDWEMEDCSQEIPTHSE